MKDDALVHLESTHITIVADEQALKPGETLKLAGGYNELSIESTGNIQDSRKLKVNDVEVITEESLKSYANGILNTAGSNFASANSPTVRIVGKGSVDNPVEAQVNLPAATETTAGIVKVVNEGSHGFPCPGVSSRTSAGVYDPATKTALILRNGADDLERDVFISYLNVETAKLSPTAERFRIPALPITAKPLTAMQSGPGTILLNTTDGLFVLLTNESIKYQNWRAIKLSFATEHRAPIPGDPNPHHWRGWQSILVGSKLYLLYSFLSGSNMHAVLWEGDVTSANALTMTFKPLTGTNFNGTAQTGTDAFFFFDKIHGSASEKCMVYTDSYWSNGLSIAHSGDEYDVVREGNRIRVCHENFNYASNPTDQMNSRSNVSYVLDLATKTVTPDRVRNYPMAFTRTGWAHGVDRSLFGINSGNDLFTPIRSNGAAISYNIYDLYMSPYLTIAENSSGLSDFDNLIAGNNIYTYRYAYDAVGLYGSDVTMSWGAVHMIDDVTMVGIAVDGKHTLVEVDPYGTYGPNVKGYGPTNNRRLLSWAEYINYKQLVSCYDSDRIKLQGTFLNDEMLSCHSQLDRNNKPEAYVSIPADVFNAFKSTVLSQITTAMPGITQTKMTLMVHRSTNAPCIGLLQVMCNNPDGGSSKVIFSTVFTYKPNQVVGEINALRLGVICATTRTSSSVTGFGSPTYASVCANALVRLNDGNYALTITGFLEQYIGNSSATQAVVLWNRQRDQLEHATCNKIYTHNREGYHYTREFGFGWCHSSASGESYYLDSFGNTMADVKSGMINRPTTNQYALVMSRMDAGDNVTVSQLAATNVKAKYASVVPKSRTVQGMDLTQDRTITKAQIANCQNIENIADISYPTRPGHTESLASCSRTDHTHQPSDFTMSAATPVKYGIARLCGLGGADGDACGTIVMTELPTHTLINRPTEVIKLDTTMKVDVEI